jgi:hypothetical protein
VVGEKTTLITQSSATATFEQLLVCENWLASPPRRATLYTFRVAVPVFRTRISCATLAVFTVRLPKLRLAGAITLVGFADEFALPTSSTLAGLPLPLCATLNTATLSALKTVGEKVTSIVQLPPGGTFVQSLL